MRRAAAIAAMAFSVPSRELQERASTSPLTPLR